MSDLIPTLTPLAKGLDLKSPALLAEPGSLLSCLNYEVTSQMGYRRLDGFVPYDGKPTLKDFEGAKYWSRLVILNDSGDLEDLPITDTFILDDDGNHIGWCLSLEEGEAEDTVVLEFISFLGDPNISGTVDGTVTFYADVTAPLTEISIPNTALNTLETSVRELVAANTEESIAVGLHWHRDHLYGVFPLVCIAFQCDSPVEITAGTSLVTTLPDAMPLVVLDKIVTSDTEEVGFIICLQTGTGEYEAPTNNTYELSGGVDGGADPVYHQTGSLAGITSLAAHLWKATRQSPYVEGTFTGGGGWNPLSFTYAVHTDIALAAGPYTLKAIKRGYAPDEATRIRFNSTVETILEDFYVVSGDPNTETARVILQVAPAAEDVLVPFSVLESEWAVELSEAVDPLDWNVIGDTVSRPRLVFLAGVMEGVDEVTYFDTVDTVAPTVEENILTGLSHSPSKYTWKSANFFATEATDAFYGCSGAGRAFACTPYTLPNSGYAGTYSWIYTQPIADKDKPRHVENHNQHLMLGFGPGSVQTSVVGEPTNYQGVEGAAEIGVGDRVTGLLALSGSTTAIFCESSIWALQGQTLDNFNTQILSPNVGAIEYTVANFGTPGFLNQYGISTLEQTASYGDFEAGSVSQMVSPWLVARCYLPYPNADFYEGVVCAMPVRKKNQYRVFFNDGDCLIMTLTEDGPAFTRAVYQVPVEEQVDNKLQRLIPLAWTSQVDNTGRERIMVSHYDKRVVYPAQGSE